MSLFCAVRILRRLISADDLSVCRCRGARRSFSPVDLVIVCMVLVLDTFLRPVLFAPLSVFAVLYSLVLLHIYDLSCNVPFTTRPYVLLPALNIDDLSACTERRKWAQARMKEVKGDDLSGRRLLFGPLPLGVSRTRGRVEL
jgi:hypothetical protein